MEINWIAVLVAALVPLFLGFIWYNPKVFGNAWMKTAGMTEEKVNTGNMALIFGLSFLFSLMLSLALNGLIIHQFSVMSLFVNEPGFSDPDSEIRLYLADFMERFGTTHRTFSHGAFHGGILGIFVVLPILGTNALFERKGFKYIAINVGYWTLALILMGGIICSWI